MDLFVLLNVENCKSYGIYNSQSGGTIDSFKVIEPIIKSLEQHLKDGKVITDDFIVDEVLKGKYPKYLTKEKQPFCYCENETDISDLRYYSAYVAEINVSSHQHYGRPKEIVVEISQPFFVRFTEFDSSIESDEYEDFPIQCSANGDSNILVGSFSDWYKMRQFVLYEIENNKECIWSINDGSEIIYPIQ